MLPPKAVIDLLASQASRLFSADSPLPRAELEAQLKMLLQSGLSKLDLVSRDEFDSPMVVLQRTRARLESLEEVTEAYYTTGHYSIFIKVMCKSIDALQQVLINKIQTIDEIQSTETLIVLQNPIMRTIKP